MSTTKSDELKELRLFLKACGIGVVDAAHAEEIVRGTIANEVQAAIKPAVPGDGELREKVHDKLAQCAISYAKYGGGGQYFYDYADAIMQLIASQAAAAQERALQEARYMGAADFANWIINNDESSFRQERAWFKIKPGLLLKYQADLMEGLDTIHSNIGLDPNATVPQLAAQPKEQQEGVGKVQSPKEEEQV